MYQLTAGLQQRSMRRLMAEIAREYADAMPETIPLETRLKHSLVGRVRAALQIHLPDSHEELRQARRRIIFEEFYLLQLGLLLRRQRNEMLRKSTVFKRTDGPKTRALLKSLPFQLTQAQRRALGDIMTEMRSLSPMNRLLQGDVGSGKTVVAAMAMACAVDSGYQAALMAPTASLAQQHYETLSVLLSPIGIRTVLIKGGMPAAERRKALEELEKGDASVGVGTHALIEKDVKFAQLGLAIVDEQHRFGVEQRERLMKKGVKGVDTLLVMTATPIPRTLALTAYGDMSQSIIDELPAGRLKVETRRFDETRDDYERVFNLLTKELKKGRQAYVVYPLVESSEAMGDIHDAVNGHQRLSNRLPDWNVGLLHGRMSGAEKLEAMEKFKSGETHVLVSTTVIEVGIDVPNASLMIVIHADRFGLSQLHQLRGRVGRGPHQSYCALVGWGKTDESQARLEAMVQTTDGFEIAEKDLEIRGPGEVLGTRQSGLPDLTMAHLTRDSEALKAARDAAAAFIDENPDLGGPGCDAVRAWLSRKWGGRLRLASVG